MNRILTLTFMLATIIAVASPVEARRCLTGNGASLNGIATTAPVVIAAIELPSN